MGNSSKEGRGYTKTGLNSGTCLEIARPRKSIPTLFPWKRGNSLGTVNSKVGIWAPACSLIIQEAWPNHLRLAPLPSKSCNYCNPDRRCFKTLFWGQANYFYQPPSETTSKWERTLCMSDQRILRHQVVLMENPGLAISPCEVLNPATLLPTPEGSLPFHSCLETLGHWAKPWEGLSEDPLTNPKEIWYTDGSRFILDGNRRARYAVVSNFETREAKPLPRGQQAMTWSDSSTSIYKTTADHGKYHSPLDRHHYKDSEAWD